MRTRTPDEFLARFLNLAEDSDYSRYPSLRDSRSWDIEAAAHALWAYAAQKKADLSGLDGFMVITAMLAQANRWGDEGGLVSVEFGEYWDVTDSMGFSHILLKDMKRELAARYLESRKDSHVAVNNRNGIWLFNRDTLAVALRDA